VQKHYDSIHKLPSPKNFRQTCFALCAVAHQDRALIVEQILDRLTGIAAWLTRLN
jgi:hypothetical protein